MEIEENEMSKDEVNDIKDERDCKSCVWRSEDGCHSWECEYLSYHDLHEYIEEHPELRGKRIG